LGSWRSTDNKKAHSHTPLKWIALSPHLGFRHCNKTKLEREIVAFVALEETISCNPQTKRNEKIRYDWNTKGAFVQATIFPLVFTLGNLFLALQSSLAFAEFSFE
jgi:hypothetical protein